MENGESWCKFTLEGTSDTKSQQATKGEVKPSAYAAPAGLPTPDFVDAQRGEVTHDQTIRWESDLLRAEKDGRDKTKASHHHHTVPMASALQILPPLPNPAPTYAAADPSSLPASLASRGPATATWCPMGDQADCNIPPVAARPSCVSLADSGMADLLEREEMADYEDSAEEVARTLARVVAAKKAYRRAQNQLFDKLP